MSSQILRFTKNHSADYFYSDFLAADPIRISRLSVCYPTNDDYQMDDDSSLVRSIDCVESHRSFARITCKANLARAQHLLAKLQNETWDNIFTD